MSETLIIKNFGPIELVELELKKFNVIIGENATGKSTLTKILAISRYFSFIVKTQFNFSDSLQDLENENINNDSFFDGLGSWGLHEFLKPDSEIYYSNKDYSYKATFSFVRDLTIPNEDGGFVRNIGVNVNFELNPVSQKFKDLLNELNKLKPQQKSDLNGWYVPTSFFQNDVSSVMENPFFLPTERGLQSIFSLGKNSIQNISDSLFNQFANLDLIAKNFKNETFIDPLEITYKNVDGRGYIKKQGKHEYVSLFNGASGYKSAIPIVLAMKYYSEVRKKNKTFLIEEPELNLFPNVQRKLVNYLVSNSTNYDNTILLTTHSPYILTSLNNLMYAYEVGQKYEDEVSEVIEKKYWINPDEVSSYRLLPNGKCENIISKSEDGTLIRAEEIDEISKKINKEFDQLINIEIKHTNEVN